MHCPRCRSEAEHAGEITTRHAVTGAVATHQVYQCPRCVVPTEVLGVPCHVAYTFAVDAAGQTFDGPSLLPPHWPPAG